MADANDAYIDALRLLIDSFAFDSGQTLSEQQTSALVDLRNWLFRNTLENLKLDAGAVKSLLTVTDYMSDKEQYKEQTTHAARALANLTGGDEGRKRQIVDAGVVPRLFNMLNSRNRSSTEESRRHAVHALANLADGDEGRSSRVTEAVQSRVDQLTGHRVSRGVDSAAKTLATLMESGDKNLTKLVADAGAVSQLVAVLNHPIGRVADVALTALVNLIAGGQGVNGRFEMVPPLVALLLNRSNDTRYTRAANALRMLAAGNDDDIKRHIATTDGAVPRLVALLADAAGDGTETIRHAAAALQNLAAGGQDVKRHIAMTDRAVPSLVALLADAAGDGTETRRHAAAALRNLASGGEDIKADIEAAAAVPALVALLKAADDETARHAAAALRNLAAGDGEGRMGRMERIKGAGAVPALLALAQGGNPHAAEHAQLALRNLGVKRV